MSGPDDDEPTERHRRSSRPHHPSRAFDKDRLDRLLDQARTQGPTLLVVGDHRMILCLESDLPGAAQTDATVAERPPGSTKGDTDGSAVAAPHRTREDATPDVLDVSTVTLTPRELEIAKLAAAGQRAAQIAQTLGIATQTVRVHLNAVRVRCRAATVQDALRALARQHSWLG